jgi:uncharacterized protein (DUF2384 family)
MSVINILRDEYPGDDAWKRFVAVFRPVWEKSQGKEFDISRFGDEGVAIVLRVSMGDSASDWFNRPCGSLGKRAPVDVMASESLGVNVIRTLLMRMPR